MYCSVLAGYQWISEHNRLYCPFHAQNNHMHAIVSPEIWNQMDELIIPGTVYIISNMNVSPATGLFRPVHATDCIHFTPSTTVVVYPNNDLSIPMHKFVFTPLNEFDNRMFYYYDDHQPFYSTGK